MATSEKKAKTQEQRILEFFQTYAVIAGPSYVKRKVLPNAPLTSVRRAITNLASKGKLRKTSTQAKGFYGKPEDCGTLNTGQGRLLDES